MGQGPAIPKVTPVVTSEPPGVPLSHPLPPNGTALEMKPWTQGPGVTHPGTTHQDNTEEASL